MSVGYAPVQWNRHKRVYDLCLGVAILFYLGIFFAVGKLAFAGRHAISDEILAMRALGTCALLLLHLILCIGPLARRDPRFLPLLYNRRHLGVVTFLIGLAHGVLATIYYHGFGRVNPLASLLLSNTNYTSLSAFPFQVLGLAALIILFLMAATSHDFWLKNLGAPAWKRIHMLVYAAYGLLILHDALGILQTHRSPWLAGLIAAGVILVAGLHIAAGLGEAGRDGRGAATASKGSERRSDAPPHDENWVDVGSVDDLFESRGSAICVGDAERIAVFRHNGSISATSNVCAHQGGPLGEGKIIDGCITCPWHGWQYRPADGRSPPPFTEKIATYRVRVIQRRIQIDPTPLPPGTPVEPARIDGDEPSESGHG